LRKETSFIAVVGQSGVGKDSVLAYGRQKLAGDARFVFPKRWITWLPEPDEEKRKAGEDYVLVPDAEFQQLRGAGRFCLLWFAHGNSYGIPQEATAESAGWRIVIASLSRTALPQALEFFPGLIVAEIWALPGTIAERSFDRGRDSVDEIARRLAREAPIGIARPIVRIGNEGPVELAGEVFVDLVLQCASGRRS
jgi:ribose 1,5-bisphosphokinase